MNILVLDCTFDGELGWEFREEFRSMGLGSLVVRRVLTDLPDISECRHFSAVVVSGSRARILERFPWSVDLEAWIRTWICEEKKAYLGICYGHQILHRAFDAKSVGAAADGDQEFGLVNHSRSGTSWLLKDFPESFIAPQAHRDVVFDVVKIDGCAGRVVASSERCAIQAVEWDEFPVAGVQFHPERQVEKRRASGNMREDICDGEYLGELRALLFHNFVVRVRGS